MDLGTVLIHIVGTKTVLELRHGRQVHGPYMHFTQKESLQNLCSLAPKGPKNPATPETLSQPRVFPTPPPFASHGEQRRGRRLAGGWRQKRAPGRPSYEQGGRGGRRSRRSVDRRRGGPRNPRRCGPPLPRGLRRRRR